MSLYETTNDALIECVKAAGGSKRVGAAVWPEKTIDAAQRHLLNCLNEGKPERLTPDQVLLIAKLARDAGCHAYQEYVSQALAYSMPTPIEPEDQAADLQRQFIAATEQLAAMAERIGKFQQIRRAA